MVPQIARSSGRAVAREIVGRSDDPAPHRAQPPGDQAGIGQIGDAQRDIDAAGNQVHHPIIELEIDRDLRIGGQKLGQCRRDMAQAERHRRGQPHPAARHR